MKERIRIINGRIVTPDEVIKRGAVYVENGRISAVAGTDRADSDSETDMAAAGWRTVDARNGWILPGFVDVHVHGGFGSDFMEATPEAYARIARFHGAQGTTAMLATTVTAPKTAIDRVLETAASCASVSGSGENVPVESRSAEAACPSPEADWRGARIVGVHLEGPFISAKWPGAQNPAHIVPPNRDWVDEWTARYPGLIRLLTLAPETEGAPELIERVTALGITAACGHTDARYADMRSAADRGLRHAVHSYNAMRGLHHREPGTVGAVMDDDRITAEVIADGHHVHPAAIRLLARIKPADRLIAVTDAIQAAGLGDGEYSLGGLGVRVQGGVVRLIEGDSLAGSTLTMIGAFRYLVREVGLSPELASRMSSGNPARAIGIDGDTGSIAVGKRADLVVLTPELDIIEVLQTGRSIAAL